MVQEIEDRMQKIDCFDLLRRPRNDEYKILRCAALAQNDK
jgi:hypothetical protein